MEPNELPPPGQKAKLPDGSTVEWSFFKTPEMMIEEWGAASVTTEMLKILAADNPEAVREAMEKNASK